jgi:hypothetical protein
MPPVSMLLNILWIIFGGLWMAAGWVIAAIVMAHHHYRPALGKGRLQYRRVYVAAVRAKGGAP